MYTGKKYAEIIDSLGLPDLNGSNLNGYMLSRADLEGVTITGANFLRAGLQHAKLTDARISDTIMNNAILTGANIDGAEFTNIDGNNMNLSSASGQYSIFDNCILLGIRTFETNLSNVYLKDCDMSYSTFFQTLLTNGHILNCNCNSLEFSQVTGTNLVCENMDLTSGKIAYTNLQESRFANTLFIASIITNVNFSACVFNNTDFTNAIVSNVSFNDGILENVNFSKVILDSIDLTNVRVNGINITDTHFVDCRFDGAQIIDPTSGEYISLTDYLNTVFQTRADAINTPEEITSSINDGYISSAIGDARMNILMNDEYRVRAAAMTTGVQVIRAREQGLLPANIANNRLREIMSRSAGPPVPHQVQEDEPEPIGVECDNDTDFISGEPWSGNFMPNVRIRYLPLNDNERDQILCMRSEDLIQWITSGQEFRAWYPNPRRLQSGEGIEPNGHGGRPSNIEKYYRMPIFNQLVVNSPENIINLVNMAAERNEEIIAYVIYTNKLYGTGEYPYFTVSGVHGQRDQATTVYLLTIGDPTAYLVEYLEYAYRIRGLNVPAEEGDHYLLAERIKDIPPVIDRTEHVEDMVVEEQINVEDLPENTVAVRINDDNTVTLYGPEDLTRDLVIISDINTEIDINPNVITVLVTPEAQEVLSTPLGVYVIFTPTTF